LGRNENKLCKQIIAIITCRLIYPTVIKQSKYKGLLAPRFQAMAIDKNSGVAHTAQWERF
jgi:hypothetical protein